MMRGIAFDVDNASICQTVGAGTDYTAYFLWRLHERASLSLNLEPGYIETMTTIGKGILYNGLSVVVGFVVFLFKPRFLLKAPERGL